MQENKRSEDRYRVPDGTYLHLQTEHDIVGRILDISAGGVGFEYVQLWDNDKIAVSGGSLVAGILNSGNYLLKGASCSAAYCLGIRSESPFAGTVPTFRCGMQFQRLSRMQQSQLQAILDSCKNRRNCDSLESVFNLSKFAATAGKPNVTSSPD